MTHLLIFFLLTLIGGLLIFLGTKTDGIPKLVSIVLGSLLLIPGIYGLFTFYL